MFYYYFHYMISYFFISDFISILELSNKFHNILLKYLSWLGWTLKVFSSHIFYTISFPYHHNFTCFQYFFIHSSLHVFIIVSFHNSSMFHLGFDISFIRVYYAIFVIFFIIGSLQFHCRLISHFTWVSLWYQIWIWTCLEHVQVWSCFIDLNVNTTNLQTDCKSDNWFKS